MAEEKQTSYFDEASDSESISGFDAESEIVSKGSATSRIGAIGLRFVMPVFVCAACCIVAFVIQQLAIAVVGFIAALVLFSCTHVVLEWERSVVMRCGRFHRVAGPGLIFMVPFIDYVAARVDMRMRSTAFRAEHVLTADLVPVDVDAVLFWTIWDAEKACSEVQNYERLVYWVAQTTLRDVMGGVNIAQLSTRRVQLDKEIADILDRKTNEWGVTVSSVEIRDIEIPFALQESLSAEARAERECNARAMLAEVERDISEMFVDAAETYGNKDAALQLRAMSFVADSVKEKGGLVVVPSAISEAFDGLEKLGGLK